MAGRTARRRVTRVSIDPAAVTERADLLAAEEPLGIRIDGQAVSLTMRTPGDDIDLVAGFLLSAPNGRWRLSSSSFDALRMRGQAQQDPRA